MNKIFKGVVVALGLVGISSGANAQSGGSLKLKPLLEASGGATPTPTPDPRPEITPPPKPSPSPTPGCTGPFCPGGVRFKGTIDFKKIKIDPQVYPNIRDFGR